MTERKRNLGSNLAKVDAHTITPEEYAEIRELDDEWFARAEPHVAGKRVGRPRSATRKHAIKLRLDPQIIAAYRATGPGWQTRINAALRETAHKATSRVTRKAAHKVARKTSHGVSLTYSKRKTTGRGGAKRK